MNLNWRSKELIWGGHIKIYFLPAGTSIMDSFVLNLMDIEASRIQKDRLNLISDSLHVEGNMAIEGFGVEIYLKIKRDMLSNNLIDICV